MKKKIGSITIVLGIICVLVALIIYLDLSIKDHKYAEENDIVIEKIKEVIEDQDKEPEEKIKETVEIDGKKYVGILSIPSIDLYLPIQEEWTKEKSKNAPGIYRGTFDNYPLIIGGHNNKSQFNKLYKIKDGAEVTIIKLNGEKISFKVKKIETIHGKDVKGMIETDYPLTLFTCTFNNQSRFTVRCI